MSVEFDCVWGKGCDWRSNILIDSLCFVTAKYFVDFVPCANVKERRGKKWSFLVVPQPNLRFL